MFELCLTIDEALCGECGGCVAVCPFDAIILEADGVHEIEGSCTLCNLCVITCPSRAILLKDEIKV